MEAAKPPPHVPRRTVFFAEGVEGAFVPSVYWAMENTPVTRGVDLEKLIKERQALEGANTTNKAAKDVADASSSVARELNKELQDLRRESQEMEKRSEADQLMRTRKEEIVARSLEIQRLLVHETERKQHKDAIDRMRDALPHVTEEECLAALGEVTGEEAATALLFDFASLRNLRKKIAKSHTSEDEIARQKRVRAGEWSNDGDASTKLHTKSRKKKKITVPKLKLDDAVSQGSMAGWSSARVRAWKLRDTNPNAYYYRFNEVGEQQKHGKWSDEEKKLFLSRIDELGVDGQWGLFSKGIPGRVGYQCANFYRLLIESHEITDSRYYLDDNGKVKPTYSRGERGVKRVISAPTRRAQHKRRKQDADGQWRPKREIVSNEPGEDEEDKKEDKKDLLPGVVDPITCMELTEPTMSPDGHVCNYDTWLKSLNSSGGFCPFTKKPLKKRDLILLTSANIDEHRSRIVS